MIVRLKGMTELIDRVSQMGSTGGGDNLGKMVKNCMKMKKSVFLGQNSVGDIGGDKPNFRVVGGGIPPLGGTPIEGMMNQVIRGGRPDVFYKSKVPKSLYGNSKLYSILEIHALTSWYNIMNTNLFTSFPFTFETCKFCKLQFMALTIPWGGHLFK